MFIFVENKYYYCLLYLCTTLRNDNIYQFKYDDFINKCKYIFSRLNKCKFFFIHDLSAKSKKTQRQQKIFCYSLTEKWFNNAVNFTKKSNERGELKLYLENTCFGIVKISLV